MGFELRISPLAIDEIDEAFSYYLQISESIAESFDDDLNNAFDLLEDNPYFQNRYKDIRALPLKIFPFLLFFTIEGNIIDIHSVFHTSQNPEKYPKR